jgi:cytochrome c oxidase assembly protein subunit 15
MMSGIERLPQTGVDAVAAGNRRAIAVWLLACAAMILVMVVLGGVTRLTESGLSITEWQPIAGILPPLSEAAWQAEFAKYREIPQFQLVHSWMSIEDFKTIYFWEWLHRLWGRLIGIAFAVPFLWFLLRRRIPAALMRRLLGLLVLGGLQGVLGWVMVESGLVDRVEVSQYRLVAHLGLAIIIYAAILWTALDLLWAGAPTALPLQHAHIAPPPLRGRAGRGVARAAHQDSRSRTSAHALTGTTEAATAPPTLPPPQGGRGPTQICSCVRALPAAGLPRAAAAVAALIFLTLLAGGFVAGLNAGLTYNTFPLMDGSLVPAGYWQLQPWWRNFFENVAAVQFDHRLLALLSLAAIVALWLAGHRHALAARGRYALDALLAMAVLQVALGVATLLLVVPLPIAAAHQAGAVLLFTAALAACHALRQRPIDPARTSP